ncbi:CCR4-NOT core subunit cdc39, partial [Coemansia sp. RSA 2599]
QLVTADPITVESVIQGILASAPDNSTAASIIIQALAATDDGDKEEASASYRAFLKSIDDNSLERTLWFTRDSYWTSLAVISALAKSPVSAFHTQAKSLLPSYLARFSEERQKLGSAAEDTLPFIFDNLSSIGVLPKGHRPSNTAAHSTMGLAEHIIRAGPRASMADIVASYAQQQQKSDGRQAAGGEASVTQLTVEDVAKAVASIASQAGQEATWNAKDFAHAVNAHCSGLSWEDVLYRLPYQNLNVQHESGVSFIVESFLAATSGHNRPFPYSFMYEIWPDPQAQVSFLRFALRASAIAPYLVDKHMPAVVSDPLETLYQVYHPEFARIVTSPWNSLSLILVISHLLDSKASEDARALLDYGISKEPLLITLALARLKVQHPRLQALLQHNVARFLKREFGHSGLFFELFRIFEKKIMLALFCNLHRKDPVYARSILGVLVDLGVINEVLLMPKREDIVMLDFIVELAVFASRRGYIAFESWFPGLLAELGNEMLHASLEILHAKLQLEAARQRGEDSGMAAYSSSELTIMFKALGVMNMSPNNAANLKALYAQFFELAPELERAENEHSADEGRIEKEAESLFLRLYRGELSVDRMVDVLEDLHDSFRLHMRKTYAHVIQYPLEEFGFFDNYPEKELAITGQLVGALIQRHMLVPTREPAILDMIIRALQSAPTSKSFHFGMTALQACQTRIEQLPVFCAAIYQIAAFRQNTSSPVVQLVQSIIGSALPQPNGKAGGVGHMAGLSGVGNNSSAMAHSRDNSHGVLSAGLVFHSIRPSPLPVIDEPFAEPPEDAKDKIQFAVNNLAPNNLEEKTREVDKLLLPRHFVWFSQDIVVKRASQEPNYHSLYLQFVEALDRPLLLKFILRETLVSISRLLNAESTISSSSDRGYLKNLGAWLGGITLARDQPILRENVSFKDLLCEGFAANRLLVAIPFVCKVVEQAARSSVFHPPNPWLMSIMRVLSELYATANLKLNLTFEIEVLCKALDLDVKEITPSSILGTPAGAQRGSVDMLASELAQASIGGRSSVNPASALGKVGDGNGGAGPAAGAVTMPVLSGADISVDILTVLTQHASFHAAESLFAQQPTIKKMFYMLTERMIREIIPIHVARSIFVAVSCTRDTIQKDFCGEPNEENVHRAAQVMARGLAGALVVSLCREQLKSKLYLTMREFLIGHQVPEQSANSIAVGLVADNLDLACAIAEKESIERASVQIDAVLSEAYIARKRTRERTGQPFYDMARFSRLVYPPDFSDLLKVRLNGLQAGHLRIYEDFTQIPHFFSQIGGAGVQGMQGSSMTPGMASAGSNNEASLAQGGEFGGSGVSVDGAPKFSTAQCFERFATIINDLDKVISAAGPNVLLSQLPSQHEACLYARDIIVLVVRSTSPDETAMDFAQALVNYLYRAETSLGIDLYVLLLARMCEMSSRVGKEVTTWLAFADDERKYNVPVTVALINEGLVSIDDQDEQLSRLIEAGRSNAIDFAVRFVRKAVLERSVQAVPRSFEGTLQGFVKLAQSGRAPPAVVQLLEDLQASSQQQQQQQSRAGSKTPAAAKTPTASSDTAAASSVPPAGNTNVAAGATAGTQPTPVAVSPRLQETASYQNILLNWTRVYDHPAAGEPELTTLVRQLRQQVPLQETNVAAAFFRACVEAAVAFYNQTASSLSAQAALRNGAAAPSSAGYQVADALVRLVVYLIKLGPVDGQSDALQPLRMFLSSVTLTVVQVHATNPEVFSMHQKPFFRLLCNVLYEINTAAHAKETWCTPEMTDEVLSLFGDTMVLLAPSTLPGFSFVWMMLVSHRYFFPRLMANKDRWSLAASLLECQLRFLEPFISGSQVSESLKLLYRGMVCVILVVLHDFPEFLADYALYLCDAIPVGCVQLRNLLLSAYPRDMRLPEPLTPNLKIDLLPDVARSPEIPFDYASALRLSGIDADLEKYLLSQKPVDFAKRASSAVLVRSDQGAAAGAGAGAGKRYDVARINAFVLHAVVTITKISDNAACDSAQRVALELFRAMLTSSDAEGSYLFVGAIANQLRFPSAHTCLCSRMILALFSKSDERVRECIARVLIERILVNRPFPWGLLVTLIELLRNPFYSFWNHEFTRRSPQIVEILSAVAKSIHPVEARTTPQTSQPLAQ